MCAPVCAFVINAFTCVRRESKDKVHLTPRLIKIAVHDGRSLKIDDNLGNRRARTSCFGRYIVNHGLVHTARFVVFVNTEQTEWETANDDREGAPEATTSAIVALRTRALALLEIINQSISPIRHRSLPRRALSFYLSARLSNSAVLPI